ncbi:MULTISPECIES: GT4 family glycosyltransferase PelF [Planktothrix]|jgi:glycosyltransferase involved in cell wall biosynthesis|uniref:GT4 family glycosyltransferase PelF n=1 Tax=Planktothrix TaxID=54304 RepID=UPI00055B83D2|nr:MULTISPECIES: GT4 family glycosyltransferase PelF [Planktothrix]MCB8778742.1 GT4 family glycosyltransferase PelF [Planktothrix agardhii 1031]MCB8787180.1 GT4 family glycosyltransferase PelF [Planktothrix agardhii 1025]MCF3597766.1 GT4 family glycosyltransferase PelF [Planktothrix agardhii 1032]MCF3613699.1 GT4 family glycosyltransferase PelF [Planktothrix agardhii 1027]MCF3647683.1 GT4 family glycosyltransferase PelF [Planktothrix agardhii 1026]
MSRNRPSVLLTTEGTYPFHKGGVSTWCHVLTQELPEIDFKLFAIVANPYLPLRYNLSANVKQVVKLPLWGIDDPVEYSWHSPFSNAIRSKFQTTPKVIATQFLPRFEKFIQAILFEDLDINQLGELLLDIHKYFLHYDYHITMMSASVWSVYQQLACSNWQIESERVEPNINELAEAIRLLYRFFLAINIPVPHTDITHSSAAAFCGLPCVIAKLERGTPYLLTEHGINIREQYLNLNRSIPSVFVRRFLYKVVEAVVRLNYHFADQVSPVCEYNARWEKWWGVPPENIKVIYNGADPEQFHPTPPVQKERPQVMNMGLIFPLKGQLDLIEAAAIVRDKIPNVEFRFYGKASDEGYYAECLRRVEKYGIEKNINFAGFTSEPWRAYSEADVVAMSSISEGFPYAVIEAMLSGATIVSTDVGGVSEALGDTGLMVKAGRPPELAAAILKLLELPETERRQFGQRACDRALDLFTQRRFLDLHLESYYRLINQPVSDLENQLQEVEVLKH